VSFKPPEEEEFHPAPDNETVGHQRNGLGQIALNQFPISQL